MAKEDSHSFCKCVQVGKCRRVVKDSRGCVSELEIERSVTVCQSIAKYAKVWFLSFNIFDFIQNLPTLFAQNLFVH